MGLSRGNMDRAVTAKGSAVSLTDDYRTQPHSRMQFQPAGSSSLKVHVITVIGCLVIAVWSHHVKLLFSNCDSARPFHCEKLIQDLH